MHTSYLYIYMHILYTMQGDCLLRSAPTGVTEKKTGISEEPRSSESSELVFDPQNVGCLVVWMWFADFRPISEIKKRSCAGACLGLMVAFWLLLQIHTKMRPETTTAFRLCQVLLKMHGKYVHVQAQSAHPCSAE